MNAQSPARSLRARFGGRERGTAALETAALLPLIIFFGFVVLQVGIAMWTMVEADTAVRSAARAASLSTGDAQGDALKAAKGSLPGVLSVKEGTLTVTNPPNGFDGVAVTMDVEIPGLRIEIPGLPVFGRGTVTRHAEMPTIR
jgi:Flp pilus assembly protein TadG